jgi:hypothetical protein
MAVLASGQAAAGYGLAPYEYHPIAPDIGPVAIGDVTGDGRNDVVVTSVRPDYRGASEVFVFEQLPDGSLAAPKRFDPGPADLIGGLALADLNRDGTQDIVVGNDDGITMLLSRRGRAQQPFGFKVVRIDATASVLPYGASASDIVVVDVNRDGHLDIVGQNEWYDAILYFGDGQGGITSTAVVPTRLSGNGANDLEVGDVNGDGFPDLVITSPFDTLRVLHHDGVSGYRPAVILQEEMFQARGVAIGDFNQDGRNDLVSTTTYSIEAEPPYHASLWLQQASGLLSPQLLQTAGSSWNTLGDDLDGDGRDDLLLVHDDGAGAGTAISFFLQGQNGLGSEHWVPQPSGGYQQTETVAAGDINGDGCKDVVTTNYQGGGMLLFYGQGCTTADLAVAIAGDASTVSIGMAALAEAQSVESPLVSVAISARSGVLQTGPLPQGCVIQSQDARTQNIECLSDTLASGATATLSIPVSVTGGGKNSLTITVEATTDTHERTLSNNRAWKLLRLPSANKAEVARANRNRRQGRGAAFRSSLGTTGR